MAFVSLPCMRDPMLDWIRETYAATPLRVPEERVQPLTTAVRGQRKILSQVKTRFSGDLKALLQSPFDAPPLKVGALAALANRKTAAVSGAVGLPILLDLIAGLGFDQDVDTQRGKIVADAIDELRFSFPEARRKYVELGALGAALEGASVQETPYTFSLIDGTSKLFIIDSVLASKSFEVKVGGSGGTSLAAAIRELGASLNVDQQGANTLRISANSEVSFAFSSIEVGIDELGNIQSLSAADLKSLSATSDLPVNSYVRALLAPEASLFEWDVDV